MTMLAWYKLDELAMADTDPAADSGGLGNDGIYRENLTFGSNLPSTGHSPTSGNAMGVRVPTTFPDPRDLCCHGGMSSAATDFSFSGAAPFTVEFWVEINFQDLLFTRGLMGSFAPAFPPGDYATWGFYIPSPISADDPFEVVFYRGDFSIGPTDRDELRLFLTHAPGASTGWRKLRGMYDGTTMSLYLDDVLVDSMVGTVVDLAAGASNLYVGGTLLNVILGFKTFRYPADLTLFDDVRVWDQALVPGRGATIAFRG